MPSYNLDHSPTRSPPPRYSFKDYVVLVTAVCRKVAIALNSSFINRRFVYAVAAFSSLGAKAIHIYASLDAIPVSDVLVWGLSFLLQDFLLLLLLRWLIDVRAPERWNLWSKLGLGLLISLIFLYVTTIDLFSTAFFVVCNVEIHWKHIALANDPSSIKLFLTGLVTLLVVMAIIISAAWILQEPCYAAAGFALDGVTAPFQFVYKKFYPMGHTQRRTRYSSLTQDDSDQYKDDDDVSDSESSTRSTSPIASMIMRYGVVMLLALQTTLLAIRPEDSSLTFLSWTPPLIPFIEVSYSVQGLMNLKPVYNVGIGRQWDDATALKQLPMPSWLSKDKELAGFEDWYQSRLHYSADQDKLKISNLDESVHKELKDKLSKLKIRNVMMVLLESTRKDLFPIKKDGYIYKRLASSFSDGKMPAEAHEAIARMTPNANFITGDYDDGFEHNETRRRGGINFNNAYTTATYTLKSLVGNTCGVTPMISDFNKEYLHRFYQPCLPHIFEAMNAATKGAKDIDGNYTSFPWHSRFMFSSTFEYDHTYPLMDAMGYAREELISREYLRSNKAKFGKVNLPNINAFAIEETPLQDYIRDAFQVAKKDNERLFLTHLTSTSHHDFHMPQREKPVELSNGMAQFSRYVNAIGFDDRWLGRIFEILEEEKVADETLMIFVGDHGLSVPENGIASPYYQPHAGLMKVPLVISHPDLPAMNIDDPVSSQQILPTILDALLESKSFSPEQETVARDLVKNYEGQSLLRPKLKVNNSTGQADWQFTIINPGTGMVAARDARRPNWRLIVPTAFNVVWRFTDIGDDPSEERPVLSFKFKTFLKLVEEKHGIEAAKWAEEGAFIGRWWVNDHHKRWRSGPYEE